MSPCFIPKTCKYKCRLDPSVCNNKQRWNEEKCRCECKELIDKEICDKKFIWNPSNCVCECDKSCGVGEYLDNRNGNKILYNETLDVISLNAISLNVYKKVCNYCIIYIILFAVFFIASICISSVFIYFHWYLKKYNFSAKFNPSTQTTIY